MICIRIISGIHKGRKLKGPADLLIRPTLDRVKESIFNVLGETVTGSTVLDLFAGSGSLGIEALSRGAKKVFFIDRSFNSIKLLKENLALIKAPEDSFIIKRREAVQFLNDSDNLKFDIIFLDPPFKISSDYMISVFNRLNTGGIIDRNSVIIYEFFFKRDIKKEIQFFSTDKISLFGEKKVIYLSLK